MTFARRLLLQRPLALLICAAAMLLRIAVPGGYMIGSDRGAPVLEVCSGVAAMPAMAMPMRGHHGDHHDGKVEMPCAFAGLAAPALMAADPVQLAALVAFIVSLGVAMVAMPMPRRPILRPPLRGPPARR